MGKVVKNIEQKIKLTKTFSILVLVLSMVVVVTGFVFTFLFLKSERKNIYVLDNGVPVMAVRYNTLLDRDIEIKATVESFHSYFFSLTPDKSHIELNVKKALNLIDGSGKREHLILKQNNWYNQLIASNSSVAIVTDSIVIDKDKELFFYYGKQLVNGIGKRTVRNLETKGRYEDLEQRSPNNPTGIFLKDWIITDNSDIEVSKRSF